MYLPTMQRTQRMTELIGLLAVFLIAPIAITITLYYSYKETKDIGNDKHL